MKKIILLIAVFSFVGKMNAQTSQNLEKIIGIVGDRIILKSDIESAFEDAKKQNPDLPESTKCEILEQTLGQKILAEQADRDSLEVSKEEVEGVLDNRIRSFVQHYGSKEKLEEVSGKSIYQLKDEYRPVFREQLKAQTMQRQVMSDVKITPEEVKTYFAKIPKDSLPLFPSMVEMGQIIFTPKISNEVEEYARKKLEGVREDIVKGISKFDEMAAFYSEDPSSRDNGGDLGFMTREQLVPAFASAAFRLQTGELSKVVKSSFGYHIIEMIERRGENAHLRHILIKPLVTSGDIKVAKAKADSVRAQLMAEKITFRQAVKEFSGDKQSRLTGGIVSNPYSGSTFLEMDKLDPTSALAIQDLKVGQYSTPHEFTTQTGDKTVRLIYLRSRTEPHQANLKDDYYKIQEAALSEKRNKYLFDWLAKQIPTFYIKIDKEYNSCPNVSNWIAASNEKK